MKLREICENITDGSHNPPSGVDNSKYLMLSSKNVFDDKITLEEPRYLSEEQFLSEDKRTCIKTGDVLMTIVGTVGRTAVVTDDMPKITLQRSVAVLHPNSAICDSRFLMYLLQSKKHFFEQEAHGVAQKGIYLKQLSEISVSIPAISKQKAIVDKLDRINNVIKSRQLELDKLDELIKARFVEMFGSIYEDKFPRYQLREVAHIKHGYAFAGEYFSDEDNGIVLVTPGNFALGGGFQETKNRYFTADYSDEYVLHAGDLIVTMTDLSKKADTLGYGAIVPDTGRTYLHNQRIGLFDYLDERLNPVFVRWYMQTEEYRLEIVRTSTGSTVHHTSPDRILNSIIYIPPLEEQKKFVLFVKQVDKSKFV